jgi:hypothetical protein
MKKKEPEFVPPSFHCLSPAPPGWRNIFEPERDVLTEDPIAVFMVVEWEDGLSEVVGAARMGETSGDPREIESYRGMAAPGEPAVAIAAKWHADNRAWEQEQRRRKRRHGKKVVRLPPKARP